jgi:hypothetical protein
MDEELKSTLEALKRSQSVLKETENERDELREALELSAEQIQEQQVSNYMQF